MQLETRKTGSQIPFSYPFRVLWGFGPTSSSQRSRYPSKVIHGLESKPEKQIYERGGPSSHAAQDRGCKNVAPPLGMALRTCERLVSFSAPAGNKPKLVEGQQSSVNIPRAIQWRLRPSPIVFSLPTCVCVCACVCMRCISALLCRVLQMWARGPLRPCPTPSILFATCS